MGGAGAASFSPRGTGGGSKAAAICTDVSTDITTPVASWDIASSQQISPFALVQAQNMASFQATSHQDQRQPFLAHQFDPRLTEKPTGNATCIVQIARDVNAGQGIVDTVLGELMVIYKARK